MRNIKGNIPNVITFSNLSLGVIAILLAVNSENSPNSVNYLFNASLLVMLAALTDRFDGKVARMLDVVSDLGKELDSLSDLISFGVAPIIIAWKISFLPFGVFGYLLAIIFPIAGAYRLARYNTTPFNNVYTGIPITFAGALLTLLSLYNCTTLVSNRYSISQSYITAALLLILSYLMVCKIKIKKV